MAEFFKRPTSPYWYVWLRDPRAPEGIVRRSTKCRHKSEARKVADAAQAEIDAEIAAELAAAAEEAAGCGLRWLDAVTMCLEANNDIKDSTSQGYGSIGEVVFRILGDFDLGTLTHTKLREFCQARRQMTVKPHGAKDTGRKVSDQTIRNNLSAMSSVYQFFIDRDLPNAPLENPLRTFDRSFLRTSKRVDRHLRPNQFQEVLDACKSDLHRRLLTTLVGTGMRASELINLYWGEVDLKNKVIEFGNIDPDRTKTSRSRRIPLLPPVFDALTAQRKAQITNKTHDRNGLVFPSPRTKEARYDLKYLARIARERAGVKGFWVHGLRHTFASWALQKGVDGETIRRLLGHTTLSTTSRYAHHVDDTIMDRMRGLDLPLTAQNAAQTNGFGRATKKEKQKKEAVVRT